MDKEKELDYILQFIEESDMEHSTAVKQLQALWTAYCFHHDLVPDTDEYDGDLMAIWMNLCMSPSNPFDSRGFHDFDLGMSRLLV